MGNPIQFIQGAELPASQLNAAFAAACTFNSGSLAQYTLLIGNGGGDITVLPGAQGSAGQVLTSNGNSNLPSWQAVGVGTNISGLTVTATGSISANQATGAYSYGTLSYTDTNNLEVFAGTVNSYLQNIIQNKSAGAAASADYVVSNNLGTATTYYGNFGMNSSGYTGAGSFNLPNAAYLTSTSGDLVIGTTTSNAIRLVVNSGATDAVTITPDGVVNALVGITSPTITGRNVIVNGDCSISQVNGGSLITPVNGAWPIDMVSYIATQASKLQVQQVNNKLNSLGATAARTYSVLSSFTPANTDAFEDLISIEGFNFARFQYGAANAKAGSLQFKVNVSVAGTYSGSICNYAGSRSYPFTFTVAANTDTLIQIPNIPGDTGGSWIGATNAGAAYIRVDLGSGTNYKSTANSWQAGNFIGVTGTTNLVSQVNGSTLTITDVQFEVGSVCTQFERKLFDQNLRESQRYLEMSYDYGTAPGTATTSGIVEAYVSGPSGFNGILLPAMFKQTKRASPTMSYYSPFTGTVGKIRDAVNAVDVSGTGNTNGTTSASASGVMGTANNYVNMQMHWVAAAQI